MTDLKITADDITLAVAADSGGRWASLRVGELELLGRGGHTLLDWGCYPMAPYAGRIRNGRLTWAGRTHQLPLNLPPHSIHGVTLDRPWQVLDADDASLVLRCDFDARWPWRGHAVQRLRVADGGVHATLEVHADDDPMPAWIGFHPWFNRTLSRGKPARIVMPGASMLPRDEAGMPLAQAGPVPQGPWDDAFVGFTAPPQVVWDDATPDGAFALELHSEAACWVIFDGKPDAVCVEPQTAPPNAVELGQAATVTPDAPLTLDLRLSSLRALP